MFYLGKVRDLQVEARVERPLVGLSALDYFNARSYSRDVSGYCVSEELQFHLGNIGLVSLTAGRPDVASTKAKGGNHEQKVATG